MNLCKECGFCCTIWKPDPRSPVKYVQKFFKGKDRWICEHYDIESGDCLIYDTRPQMCRDFEYMGIMCKNARGIIGL